MRKVVQEHRYPSSISCTMQWWRFEAEGLWRRFTLLGMWQALGSPKCVFCAQNYRGKVGVEREEGKVGLEERREQKWRMSPQVVRLSKSAVSSNASGEKGRWTHGITPLSFSQAPTVFCELPWGSPSGETSGHAINPSQIFSERVELHSSDPD